MTVTLYDGTATVVMTVEELNLVRHALAATIARRAVFSSEAIRPTTWVGEPAGMTSGDLAAAGESLEEAIGRAVVR